MRRSTLLLVVVALLAVCTLAHAFAPPPVFEHKADRNYHGTNCEVCQAVVKQALRKLPGAPDLSSQKLRRAREQKVSDALENICAVESFARYEYSPPTMVTACNDFIANNGEELEGLLFKGVTDDRSMRKRLCVDTGLCESLWSAEAEEMKRDRSAEEAKLEAEEAARKGREAEKKEKADKARKKKEEAAAKKAAKDAKAAPKTDEAKKPETKTEL